MTGQRRVSPFFVEDVLARLVHRFFWHCSLEDF